MCAVVYDELHEPSMQLVMELRDLVQQAVDAAIKLLTPVHAVRGMIRAEVRVA